MTALSTPVRVRSRETLDNSVACKHAAVDRKVSAHHEGTHSRVLLGKEVRLIGEIRLVLPAVDENKTSVASWVSVTLVHWIRPSSTPAEALKVLHVKAAHFVLWLKLETVVECRITLR